MKFLHQKTNHISKFIYQELKKYLDKNEQFQSSAQNEKSNNSADQIDPKYYASFKAPLQNK